LVNSVADIALSWRFSSRPRVVMRGIPRLSQTRVGAGQVAGIHEWQRPRGKGFE
jgi:hypothetical protein